MHGAHNVKVHCHLMFCTGKPTVGVTDLTAELPARCFVQVIRLALLDAQAAPDKVATLEMHGTGKAQCGLLPAIHGSHLDVVRIFKDL